MATKLDEFRAYRTKMNDRITEIDHLGIKRFFNLDGAAYKDGALDAKNKRASWIDSVSSSSMQRLH